MTPSGSSKVTLVQVADLAGVSVMTASYTYNQPDRVSDQARSKVLARTQPDRPVAPQRALPHFGRGHR